MSRERVGHAWFMSNADPVAAIHVEPLHGRWAVRHPAHGDPLSVHDECGEATRAAHAHARGQLRVLLRDLYGRVHELAGTLERHSERR
jgi:hypothetical protein